MNTKDPIVEAARLDAIKTICRREGHNWTEVTRYGDPMRNDICIRGCGAIRHRPQYGQVLTPNQLAALMPANGAVVITDIEIVVEPDHA